MTASQLQSGIVVGEDSITGELKNVEGYTQFNPSNVGEQSGHFLALKLSSTDDATVKTQLIGGTKPEITVDDGFCVYLIANKNSQSVKVSTEKNGKTTTKTYSLTGLTLAEE